MDILCVGSGKSQTQNAVVPNLGVVFTGDPFPSLHWHMWTGFRCSASYVTWKVVKRADSGPDEFKSVGSRAQQSVSFC